MSSEELEAVIAGIDAMQASWTETMSVEEMRSSLEEHYRQYASGIDGTIERIDANGVSANMVSVPGAATDRVILYLHGGGFAVGSARAYQFLAERIAEAADARVLLVDFRLAPEHCYPAQLDDARNAYQWLRDTGYRPEKICFAGDSAGGGLALSLLANLSDTGTTLPGCVATLSAWCDMRASGASYEELADVDPIGSKDMVLGMAAQYLGEKGDADSAYTSPVNMNFSGMPPMLVQAGTRDIFLDDSRTVANKAGAAGVDVTFAEWRGMIHVWHLFSSKLEEGRQAIAELGTFVRSHTGDVG